MAKIVIKESEIRQYVRSLIKESLDVEARGEIDPRSKEEYDKMMNGEPYTRRYWPQGSKYQKLERERRAELGLPPIPRRNKFAGELLDVNADGSFADYDDWVRRGEEGKAASKVKDRENIASLRIKAGDRERLAQKYNLPLDVVKNFTYYTQLENFINNMSDEDREMYDDVLAKQAEEANVDTRTPEQIEYDNKIASMTPAQYDDYVGIHTSDKSKEGLERRIAELKAKQEALGPHCDANDYLWRNYEYVIKDTKRILNDMYGKGKYVNNDDDDFDDYVNSLDIYQPTEDEMGDGYISNDSFGEEDNSENIDDYQKKQKRMRRENNFNDSLFDDEDDWGDDDF